MLFRSLWNTADVFIAYSKNSSTALLLDRICYIGAIFIPVFSIHFIVSVVRDIVNKNWKRVLYITYGSASFLLCFIFTPFIIREVMIKPAKEIPGNLYFLFTRSISLFD